jgi:hypothetical protein
MFDLIESHETTKFRDCERDCSFVQGRIALLDSIRKAGDVDKLHEVLLFIVAGEEKEVRENSVVTVRAKNVTADWLGFTIFTNFWDFN